MKTNHLKLIAIAVLAMFLTGPAFAQTTLITNVSPIITTNLPPSGSLDLGHNFVKPR